jgi:hypothetical protein
VCRHGKKTKGISQSQILMPNNKYAGSAVVAQSSPPVEIVRRLLGEPKAVSPSVEMGEEDTQRTSKMIQRSSAGNGDQRAWDCGSLQAGRALRDRRIRRGGIEKSGLPSVNGCYGCSA